MIDYIYEQYRKVWISGDISNITKLIKQKGATKKSNLPKSQGAYKDSVVQYFKDSKNS